MGDYTTPLSVVRYTGVGVQVENEHLGIVDTNTLSFDLENGNVIDSSYTIKYGTEGSNSLTAFTETTHYTIDLDSGSILLTSTGATLADGKEIYASYTYSPKVSNTVIETFITSAEKEVDKATGAYWGTTPVSKTAFFDGRRSHIYPSTNYPYSSDYYEKDYVMLPDRNVLEITGAYFLTRGYQVTKAYSYDDSGASFTDNTDEANSPAGTGFAPFASTTAANDILYIGSGLKFLGFKTRLFTAGVTSGTNTLQYYNGSSWVAITPTSSGYQSILDMESAGTVEFSLPDGWTQTTVNGQNLYWVRIVANDVYSTEPLVRSLDFTQDFVVSKEISLSYVDFTSYGRVTFVADRIPDGVRNVRLEYKVGVSSADSLAAEMASLFAGLRIMAYITGGSYDDATGFSIGKKQVSIGEVYVNVREVVNQFNARIKQLTKGLGSEITIVGG